MASISVDRLLFYVAIALAVAYAAWSHDGGRKGPLWYAALTLALAGILGWFWAMEIWYQYMAALPRSPAPAAGNVYPLNVHGVVVYQTLRQQLYRQRWEFWSWVVLGCGAALGALHQWLSGRRQGP